MPASKGTARTWSIAIGVNLLLGVPAIVPIWLLWYFAVNWPLAALGWTQREPTENDGVLSALIIVVPVVTLSSALWWLVDHALARGIRSHRKGYWTVCAVTTLLPTLVCIAATALP